MEQAQKFFQDKKIVVQADGVQGTVYKINSYLQSVGSAGLVTQTLRLAKSAGVSDLWILQTEYAFAVAIPTTGAMLFYGYVAIIGNNIIGKGFIITGDVLALLMKSVEIMWNSYGNSII